MDKFPVYRSAAPAGEMTAERGEGETRLCVTCRASGLWSVWAVGERGEKRLAAVRGEGDLSFCRTFSRRFLQPLGALRCALLCPASAPSLWTAAPRSALRDPLLADALPHALFCEREGRRLLAFPARTDQPFPLPPLFCFASLRTIEARAYWVFAFDAAERPVF